MPLLKILIMKRNILLLILITVSTTTFIACNNSNTKSQNLTSQTDTTSKHDTLAENEMYTCKMHQDVMSDKPGKCSKCGMTLVKQKMTSAQEKMMKEGTYIKSKD
jgi:protein-arginine kinase activator protein McsA